jgi:hypothetical protein
MKTRNFCAAVVWMACFLGGTAGCASAEDEALRGEVILERTPRGTATVEFKLPHLTKERRKTARAGSAEILFPSRTKSVVREIDGLRYTGLRTTGKDVAADEVVDVVARYDEAKQSYIIRIESTLPLIVKYKRDDKTDEEADDRDDERSWGTKEVSKGKMQIELDVRLPEKEPDVKK